MRLVFVFRFGWFGLLLLCSLGVLNLLLLLQLLLLLVVLLLHLLKLLLLLLLELLLLGFIRFLLFDLLLNLLLLGELFLLELLTLLILFLLQLLILEFVFLLELGIHDRWSSIDVSRIRRPVLIDPRIRRGIRWRADRLVVRVYLLHVTGLNVLLRVHRRGPIVVLNLARPICIVRNIVVDARRGDSGCRGDADGRNSGIRLRMLHFELTRFRDGNGAALIGLNGRLTLLERQRSRGRRSLGDNLTDL